MMSWNRCPRWPQRKYEWSVRGMRTNQKFSDDSQNQPANWRKSQDSATPRLGCCELKLASYQAADFLPPESRYADKNSAKPQLRRRGLKNLEKASLYVSFHTLPARHGHGRFLRAPPSLQR